MGEPITAYGSLPIFDFYKIPGSQANKAAIKALLVNRVGSFPRNCGFFDSLPNSRLEDHACASTFSAA